MDQLMTNLLKNATESVLERAKRSKGRQESYQPMIDVDIEQQGESVVLKVMDNGIGLPKDFSSQDSFHRTTKKKGSGLGLSIVKSIIKDHQGSFAIENRLDEKDKDNSQGVIVSICLFQNDVDGLGSP
jgi:two-component system, NtrC family, nitrogen regulation sensor histidine kinase NtrY